MGSSLRPGVVTRLRLLDDLLVAIRLLASGRHLIEDLAAELGCTRRTAYRLIESLDRNGIAVERQREGRYVYHRIDREQAAVALGLSERRRGSVMRTGGWSIGARR